MDSDKYAKAVEIAEAVVELIYQMIDTEWDYCNDPGEQLKRLRKGQE